MEFEDVWSFQLKKIAENSEFNPGDICTINDDQGNERHVLFGYHPDQKYYDKKLAQVFMISPPTEYQGPLDLHFDSPFPHIVQTDVTAPVFTSQLKKTEHRLKDEDFNRFKGFLSSNDLISGGSSQQAKEYIKANDLKVGKPWDSSGKDPRIPWKQNETSTIRIMGDEALSHILSTIDNFEDE